MSGKIFIADDEKDIRELVKAFFVNDGFEVECFPDGESLLESMGKSNPDLVVLDIMMPGMDGLTICARIRETNNVPIIFVSAKGTEIDRISGITIGADDYLVKPFSPVELVVRAKALLRRINTKPGPEQEEECLEYGNMVLYVGKRAVMIGGNGFPSTPTEFDFLLYMLRHKENAVSRKELLHELWQLDFECDTRATDDLVKRLRRKLKDCGCTVHIDSVWGFGFKLSLREE